MKYDNNLLIEAVKNSKNWRDVQKYLNPFCKISGGMQEHLIKRCKSLNIDFSHFTGSAWNKNIFNADFSLNGKGSHKKVLILERGHKCERCNLSEWLDDKIPLELEHCDGNNKNNTKENLLLLCPNCHTKTTFYRGRNINNGNKKVSDEILIERIKLGGTIRQILTDVGLTPKGGNYIRIRNLMFQMGE